jgi:hypothetical protein
MPDDTITLVSTTDSPEDVQAALTSKPVEKPAETSDETPAESPPAAEGEESETEPAERQAASEAGRLLAKRKNKIQEQIDAEIRRKHEARLDAEAEEARLYQLRKQREELEAATTPPAPPAAKAPATDPGAPLGRPEPTLDAVDENGKAKYATYEDYLSDHAAWGKEEAILAARKVLDDEKLAERDRIERDSTTRVVHERLATYNASLEEFKKAHVDFDAVFQDAKDAVQETLVGLGPQALKVIDGYTVFDAEDGPALTYYLLKHPDELKAIAMKAPPQQLVHLARLEKDIRPAGAKRTGPSAVAAVETRAPAPIKPVGSGPTATTVSPDEESYQDYKARRNRELRARQGL